jgi:N-sulfoglucosamine sulfohydrolase
MDAWFDAGLAELRAKLEETGELADTLFVFLIDNGYANGFASKGSAFEKGLRTPVFFSWPKGIAGGRTRPELVSTLDLYPTLLDYAGVPAPAGIAGIDLRPALEGRELATRDVLHGAIYQYEEGGPRQRAEEAVFALYARTERWKFVLYVRRPDPSKNLLLHEFAPFPDRARGDRDLFDLTQDPYEKHDLSGDPAHAALLDELQQGCLAWWRESGGAELELPGAASDNPVNKKEGKGKQ